jgi:hypothetical protein
MQLTSKQRNNLLGMALILFCIVGGAIGILRQKRLINDHQLCSGTIFDYQSGGRGNAGGIWIDYKYEIKSHRYSGSSWFSTGEMKVSVISALLNKTFPIIYNPDNPNISRLLLFPKDFVEFGYSFTDSLQNVLEIIQVK